MKVIQEAEARIQEKLRKEFVPEAIEWRDMIVLVVSRCTAGPQGWKGLLRVEKLDPEDKGVKKAKRTLVISGVDIEGTHSAVEKAVHKRIFG
jgi:hypothetical protein